MHGFNRSITDIIKEVKVHENTVRKRLLEFGETPSSSLTLKEFMTVDLEEEQDPPAFRNSRKKDREKMQKLVEGDEQVAPLSRISENFLRKNSRAAGVLRDFPVNLMEFIHLRASLIGIFHPESAVLT
jgi:transcription factor IIIB 90 kDa subunit